MYTPAEFAQKIGVTVHTLQRWDREGRLIAKRTLTNRRYYTDEDVRQVLGSEVQGKPRAAVVYCRVSRATQKPELTNQHRMLEQFCGARGIAVDEWIEEIGGGLNFKRTQFLALIDRIIQGEIETLVVAHQDRLTRFGFDLIHHVCEKVECTLVVMNNETLSPKREMVEDLMSIIDSFSSRLDGLRHYRKFLQKALEDDP